jgi:hypothetical protein
MLNRFTFGVAIYSNKAITLFDLIFYSFVIENVIREKECTIIVEISKLTLLIIWIWFKARNLLELNITFIAFFFRLSLTGPENFTLNTVFVILARQRARLLNEKLSFILRI